MKCLDCQDELTEISTIQGPNLDVCASRHGLWVDVGEVNLFVEDYVSMKRAVGTSGGIAVHTQTLCPRCKTPMEQETLSETSFFSCDACHGWWLPSGCLTRLNQTYKGAAVQIYVDETDLYTRAKARQLARQELSQRQTNHYATRTATGGLWFWALLFGLAFAIGGFILLIGIAKTSRSIQWAGPLDGFLFYLTVGAIAGLGLCVRSWQLQQRKRLIQSIPTSTIRSLALGLVEITGAAQPEKSLLSSPFGGLPCVFYSYAVEERIGSDKNTRWETIAKGTSDQPFFVSDTTGRVLVVPFGAELILPDERAHRHNLLGELPPTTVAGLHRLGISADGWMGSKTLRCRETFILPEEQVYVLGTAHEHGGAGDLIENASRMYIGSSRDHKFIISDRSERELLSRLRWQAMASLVGGLLLAASCLIIFFTQYLTTAS